MMRSRNAARFFEMNGWAWVAFWWLAFAGSHIAMSCSGPRRRLVERYGAGPFAGIYSLVALFTFIPLVVTYWHSRHSGPLLWAIGSARGTVPLAIILGATGVALVAASFAQPSVTGMDPRAATRAHGLTRVTRHPLFMGLAIWGLAHTLVNGFLADVIFFGGFPVYGVIGAAHQDARKQRDEGRRLQDFYDETSLLPFWAILTGRNRLELSELPFAALGIGAAVAIVLYLLHPMLFG